MFKNFKKLIIKSKKAAMFGLDARIALAIFGALSVITGAALYKAIGSAKSTALLADINEVGKAFEQYYLDTGVYPGRNATSGEHFHVFLSTYLNGDIAKNSRPAGWNGPYLPYALNGDSWILGYPSLGSDGRILLLSLASDTTLGNANDWRDTTKCPSGKKCGLWIGISNVNKNLFTDIDSQVDGSDGISAGKVRYVPSGEFSLPFLYYNYMPLSNPLG